MLVKSRKEVGRQPDLCCGMYVCGVKNIKDLFLYMRVTWLSKLHWECMHIHRWICVYMNLFLCVTAGAYVLHVSEDSSGCWSLLPAVFETMSIYSMLRILGNLACELQKSLVSVCHLSTEVNNALYGFWESELNSSHFSLFRAPYLVL